MSAFAGTAGHSSANAHLPRLLCPSNRTVDAVDTIHFLKRSGKQVAFVTNNATKSRKEYLKKVSGRPSKRRSGGKPLHRIAC